MKKTYYFSTFILFTLFGAADAQINLLHTFENVKNFNYYVNTDFKGYVIDNKIYNEDFSLRKSIDIPSLDGYKFSISEVSEKIFNLDNKLEFLVYFSNNELPNKTTLRLYNEDGNMLKDFGAAEINISGKLHLMSNGNYVLIVNKGNYIVDYELFSQYEIYSLPGKGNTVSTQIVKKSTELAYKLRPGETATMKIYDVRGRLIDTKQVDYVFDRILLNTTNYSRGAYVYEINGVAKKFMVK
ncbi:MAG: hypothetical protein LBH98_06680 [Chitinispirillales bacterium]|jgi:hypothetical protein|nr:hypothetical protein [Chitinispirillales bacterium]